MNFSKYLYYLRSDLYRYKGNASIKDFCVTYATNMAYRYIFWMRTSFYLKQRPIVVLLYALTRYILWRLSNKLQIYIPYNTKIGPGFYVGHPGNIVVNWAATIGSNCNLSPGVVIGISNRGKVGCPEIGDNVFIGPGAKIFGKIKIGDNVAIGANSVVTSDIPDSAVVVGIPAKIISYKGSKGYINRTEY